jgi:hypothetical protein
MWLGQRERNEPVLDQKTRHCAERQTVSNTKGLQVQSP